MRGVGVASICCQQREPCFFKDGQDMGVIIFKRKGKRYYIELFKGSTGFYGAKLIWGFALNIW